MTEQRSLTRLETASLLCVWYAGFKSEGLWFFGEGVLKDLATQLGLNASSDFF